MFPDAEDRGRREDVEKTTALSPIESARDGQVIEQLGTKRGIKSRQAQMIAIGGSIGTSLFIASGQALAIGGPALLLAAYVIMSLMVYGIVTAVVEVGTHLPVSGASMSMHCGRYVSKSLGVALGYLYFYSFGILAAYEITAGTILIDYWPNDVNVAVWITIAMVVIIGLNLCPVHVYAETEFYFAGIKVIMIVGLLILSLVLMLGGGPSHDRLGFRYWSDPGAANAYIETGARGRFIAFIYVWILSGFSFYFAPELIIVTSGEMKNPRKNLPVASRQFFYRLIFFYILGSIAIGAICASNSSGLVSGAGNANASPWVIAIRNAGIEVLPSVVNAGVLSSAISAGNSYLFMSGRSLYSLAVSGDAPRIFTRCNRWGVPIYAVIASSLFVPLAYMVCNSGAGVAFNWFISITNTAGYTSWILCCVTFLRFRKACNAQGLASPFRSRTQPFAAWICLILFAALLLLNGFTVFFPGKWSISGFLTAYIGIPIFLAIWLGHKFTVGKNDPWIYNSHDVDLTTGLSVVEADMPEGPEDEVGTLTRVSFFRAFKNRFTSRS
ncbi:AAT family amino acid transporter [Annulohypoxylon truncatum]|uniref:AAT family amino acid transporter n=1 Tax=Annulohypoxylon truncatum TaxID=327061 RepID=UPI002007C131|nr:AAT family amino acid transporter [Annulohypoxylon truncatum]KAI1206946.1 AAT family amino acid transporter [Annulohypoxylon truncatum]